MCKSAPNLAQILLGFHSGCQCIGLTLCMGVHGRLWESFIFFYFIFLENGLCPGIYKLTSVNIWKGLARELLGIQ